MSDGAHNVIGVDTGGTFTDLVLYAGPGEPIVSHKLPSTPDDPARAVLDGIAALIGKTGHTLADSRIVHGSTVATNALLEGAGGSTAFVTTAGFEDTLYLGRQNRDELYALEPASRTPPIDHQHTIGVSERLAHDGGVVEPLHDEQIERLVEHLRQLGIDSIAISLLHSYANDTHERRIAQRVRDKLPGVAVTVSSELLPEYREYERAATCVVNAVVAPTMSRYIGRLSRELGGERLRIMSSNGGTLSPDLVCAEPVHTVLSGPAGGVLGAIEAGRAAGFERIVTFDMGGTSTDVALCDGGLLRTTESSIAGLPVRLPMVDIHTVGAGGGSVAWVDTGGALRVGPRSAGASPGPACYGKQTGAPVATVTDAHVTLGRFDVTHPLGDGLRLDPAAARAAITAVAERLQLSIEQTAHGVLRVAEATMGRAIGRISVQRGHDPRDFVLVSFGGAGGLHACALAEQMGMTRVLVPRRPGLLSAMGMLGAPPRYDFSQAVLSRVTPNGGRYADPLALPTVREALAHLREHANAAMAREHVMPGQQRRIVALDLRYRGQSYELTVNANDHDDPIKAFVAEHHRLYGYTAPDKAVEVVNARLTVTAHVPAVVDERIKSRSGPTPGDLGVTQRVYDGEVWAEWRFVQRDALCAGDALNGPIVVSEYSATTAVPAGWRVTVNEFGQLLLERGASS